MHCSWPQGIFTVWYLHGVRILCRRKQLYKVKNQLCAAKCDYTKLYMVKDQGESHYTKAPSSLLQRSFNGDPSSSESSKSSGSYIGVLFSSESSRRKELENTGPLFSRTKQPLLSASSIHTRQPLQTSCFCRCKLLISLSFFLMCNA